MVKIIGNFEVNDWVHWKKMFDQHSNAREAAGIKTIYVGNEIENTNKEHIEMETPAAETMQSLCKILKMLMKFKNQDTNKKRQ